MQVISTSPILNQNSQNNISQLHEKNNKKDTSFNSMLERNVDEKAKTKELLEELAFVAKTGFTRDELKQIQEILDKLAEKRANKGKSAQNIEEYIQNLKADLQYAIHKVTGKQMDFDEKMLNSFINTQKPSSGLIATTTDEELRLIKELKKS